jgi:hypothetical protein
VYSPDQADVSHKLEDAWLTYLSQWLASAATGQCCEQCIQVTVVCYAMVIGKMTNYWENDKLK